MPIADVPFPKVTVCPPKGTYTNLNYDLLKAGNIMVDNSTAFSLLENFVKHFQNKDFNQSFFKISLFVEKDKYRNWYNGITEVPKTTVLNLVNDAHFQDYVSTFAKSGLIQTPHFEERFDVKKFEMIAKYWMFIQNPYYFVDDPLGLFGSSNDDEVNTPDGNMTMKVVYKIFEKESIRIKEKVLYNEESPALDLLLDSNETEYVHVFPLKRNFQFIKILMTRSISPLAFVSLNPELSTGFRVQWEFITNSTVTAVDRSSKWKTGTKHFKIMANMVFVTGNSMKDLMWNMTKQVKAEWLERLVTRRTNVDVDDMYYKMLKDLVERLVEHLPASDKVVMTEIVNDVEKEFAITEEDLDTAAKMYIYIIAPQSSYWVKYYKNYKRWMENSSLRRLLGKINYFLHILDICLDMLIIFSDCSCNQNK